MTVRPEISGIDELQGKLKNLKSQFGDGTPVVEVSFSTNYGIYVHENLDAAHVTGEAKFLEKASTRNREAVLADIRSTLKTMNFGMALYKGGLRIQREAQILTPVDTGNLKGSARTELKKL